MNRKHSNRLSPTCWWSGAFISALLLGAGGCDRSPLPLTLPPYQGPSRRSRSLKFATKAGVPQQRVPPIHVTDGDWLSGLRLQSYKADGLGKLVGPT